MRTPTSVFEELLDAYDGCATDRIMATSTPATVGERLELHEAAVRKYREEFREAMQRDEVCCPKCGRPYVLHGIACPTLSFSEEPVPLSVPEQALADANPSTYVSPEPTASAEEAFGGLALPPGQPVKPPRVGPGDHLLRPPLNLTVSGPPPTLDAEIILDAEIPQDPPPLPGLLDKLKEKLREVRSVAAAKDGLPGAPGSPERIAYAEAPAAFGKDHPLAVEALSRAVEEFADDDEEFRRRRDESAERYTRPDGSLK